MVEPSFFKLLLLDFLGWYAKTTKTEKFHLKQDLNLTEGLNPSKSDSSC